MSEASVSAVSANPVHSFQKSTVVADVGAGPAQQVRKPEHSVSMLTMLNVYEMEGHQREQKSHMDGKMIFRSVPKLQEHFNPSSYAGAVKKPGGIAFGAFVQDHTAFKGRKLVGQVLMRPDNDLPSHVRENLPDSHHDCSHALIEGLLVSESHLGQGIMKELLEKCINSAIHERVDHLHARVRVDNPDSLKGFKKMGFTVLGDPAPSPLHPHEQVYFLHLDMGPHLEKFYGPREGRAHQPQPKI